jgi:3-hydroxybutyryl-CoA dehydrogenase
MKLVALANDEQWNALIAGSTAVEWIRAGEKFSFDQYSDAAAFFILQENTAHDFTATATPVFLNSVITTLQQLNAPENVLRINGWQGFLQRPVWEIAGKVNDSIKTIAEKINKKIIAVKDEPGFVAAKIIAMIINEAYFALGEDVSSKEEIDIAMKLGTNYPYGPFEWAEKMGSKNIFTLLQKLSLSDSRYKPAPALLAATQNN